MRRMLVSILALAVLAGCNLGASQPTPFPTPDIPTIEFIFPPDGSTVIEGTDLTIDLVGRDETTGIVLIELRLNGETLREAPTEANLPLAVYRVEMNWVAQGLGLHSLSAVAYRPDGIPSDEEFITVEVVPRE